MSDLLIAVNRAASKFKGGKEALAAALSSPDHQVKPQILRNQLVGNERHFLSLDRAEEIIDLCDSDELAHAAARQRGGVFVKLPTDGAPAGDLAVLELVTHVWRANGDVGRAVDEALADGRVDEAELADVKAAIYRVQQTMVAMLGRLEGMAE
ncbi:phage regulatory CII family protein [Pseudomonas sp.]|uniref:phage regulatory CII family protein n=1 Tax=Pseudomonas sp. TaxID=306 RepID=UPI003F40F12B